MKSTPTVFVIFSIFLWVSPIHGVVGDVWQSSATCLARSSFASALVQFNAVTAASTRIGGFQETIGEAEPSKPAIHSIKLSSDRDTKPALCAIMAVLLFSCAFQICHRFRRRDVESAAEAELTSGEQPSSTRSIATRLGNIWPSVIIAGATGGIMMPLSTYISLNFFAQQYTQLDHSSIHCEISPDTSYCKQAVTDNVWWTSVLGFILAFVHLTLGPAIGVISDAYGRKPVVATCAFLGLIPIIAQGLFVYFDVSLYVWFALHALNYIPVLGVWFALVTDLVDCHSCASAFALLCVVYEIAMLMGMCLGSLLSLRVAVGTSILLHVINVCYIYFFLQETFPVEKRKVLKPTSLVPLRGLTILLRNRNIRVLCAVFVISSFSNTGIDEIGTNYYQKYFAWGKQDNYFGSILGQVSTLVWVGCVLNEMLYCCGEVGVLFAALAIAALYNVALYCTSSVSQIYALQAALSGASSLMFPVTAALKSSLVHDDEQGHIQGAVQSVKTIAGGLGPVCFGILFNTLDARASSEAATSSEWHTSKLIFVIAAMLLVCGCPLVATLPRNLSKLQPGPEND